MFAPQAVIRAQRPALHQRKSAMAPWQDDIGSRIADDARIMPIIARQSRIGGVTIGDQRRARLHVGPDESLDRFSRVVGDHRQTQSTRTGIKIFRAPSSRLGLASAPIDHLDRAGDGRSCRWRRARKRRRRRGREFPSDPPRRRLREDHDSGYRSSSVGASALQQPGRLVADAQLVFQLSRRHAVGVRLPSHAPPRPHVVSGNFDRCIAVPAASEVCWRPQSRHSKSRGRLFKARGAPLTARGTNKPVRPAPRLQKRRATRLVGKLASETPRASAPRAIDPAFPRARALKRATAQTLHLEMPKSTG